MKILHETVQSLAQLPFKFYEHDSQTIRVNPHWHQEIEINYLVQGGPVNFVIDGQTNRFQSGDIWATNHREIHSATALKNEHYLEFGLIIDDNFLQQQIPQSKDWQLNLKGIASAHRHHQSYQRIKNHLLAIQQILREPLTDLSRLNVLSHFYGLLNELGENFTQSHSNKDVSPNSNLVDDVMVQINQNYAEELDGNILASEHHISLTTLNKQFNANIQMSVNQYLRLIRLLNSRRLLLETDRTIDYIAASCGFSSGKTFNRNFKAWKGITPSDYRNNFAKDYQIDTSCF